jgi:hypothetical protein
MWKWIKLKLTCCFSALTTTVLSLQLTVYYFHANAFFSYFDRDFLSRQISQLKVQFLPPGGFIPQE